MKFSSLFKLGGASFLAVSSLFSQILGFLRDKLLSYIYGAGPLLDSYYASFRVPEFMYLSVGSFVSSAILVPLFAKKLHDDDSRVWFQKLFTTFAVFFLFIYGIVVLFLPKIINKLYGHTGVAFQKSIIIYGSILLISTFFLSLSSIISSVAQERRDFIRVGLAPLFYNLGTVLGILILRPFWGIYGVIVGVVLGSVMHLLIQMPQVKKMQLFKGYGSFIIKAFDFSLLINTLKKSFLRTFSLIASAVTFFLLTYFASLYPSGSITIIAIAFTLQTVSHTLVGVSYATVALPLLSEAFVDKQGALFDGILRRGFKKIFLVSFLITGVVAVFQYEIVDILFGGGKFNAADVYLTGWALLLFSISLYAQNSILLLSRSYYAKGEYALPLLVNVISALLTYVFAYFAYHDHVINIKYGVLAVPVAYSLAQYVALSIGLLINQLKKEVPGLYIPFRFGVSVLGIVFIVTTSMKYIISLLVTKHTIFIMHIVYSGFIFCCYLLFIYVLLGLVNDEHIQVHRLQLKNKIKAILLALLPRGR